MCTIYAYKTNESLLSFLSDGFYASYMHKKIYDWLVGLLFRPIEDLSLDLGLGPFFLGPRLGPGSGLGPGTGLV